MRAFGEPLRDYRKKAKLSQEKLGELLGQALGRHGYSGAAVSDWERGESQIDKNDRDLLVTLLRLLREHGGIHSLEEANQLLLAGKYSPLDEAEQHKVFPDDAFQPQLPDHKPITLWPPNIPSDRYYELPGRERHLVLLTELLRDPQGPPVIAIDGLGGLGKTATAVELARRALRLGLFQGVVGDSAKQEILTGGAIVSVRDAALDFDSLLNAIARQLGYWEIVTFKLEEKFTTLAGLLKRKRYLLLVDNLETADNAYALVAQLHGLLGQSRAIVTSRRKVPHDSVHSVSLTGLDLNDTILFLRVDAAQRNATQILDATDQRLAEIHSMAGGALLALKLVVAQARFLDLDLVLRQVSGASSDLYFFIFRQSWEQLSPAAQRTLIYIGRTVVTTVSWEELAGVPNAESEEELLLAIRQLVDYSLLEVAASTPQFRYGLHALTRKFINSDLPKIWRGSGR